MTTTKWWRTTNAPIVLLLLLSLALNVYWLATSQLVLQQQKSLPNADVQRVVSVLRGHVDANDLSVRSLNTFDADLYYDPVRDGDINEYECVAWRSTHSCSPLGERDPRNDRGCDANVTRANSGYCEMRHRSKINVTKRVLPLSCDSMREDVAIQCSMAHELLTYARRAVAYTHDASFSFAHSQQELLTTNFQHGLDAGNPENDNAAVQSVNFSRGVVMVVHDRVLLSAYASIRSLRQMGMALPIEVWYNRNETRVNHPLLQALLRHCDVFVRELKDPRAVKFFTKLYAVYYSAFDSVLLLDADNFAVKDPTYLFDTAAFTTHGAVFWPDYWRPNQTIFHLHRRNLLWQVFDLPFIDMFEQESGQLLIDRRRHWRAINTLLFFGVVEPRLPETLRLVWGDKDLYRLAWLKTDSAFHFIARPPGAAGLVHDETRFFCGLSMVQHDPQGEIVFLHRNTIKLGRESKSRQQIWTHIQQFRTDEPLAEYDIRRSGKIIANISKCWGRPDHYSDAYSLKAIEEFAFREMESDLLRFAEEGVALWNRSVAVWSMGEDRLP